MSARRTAVVYPAIALITGFVIFQFDKELLLSSEGRSLEKCLVLVEQLLDDEGEHGLAGMKGLRLNEGRFRTLESAVFLENGKAIMKTGDWNPRNSVIAPYLALHDEPGRASVTTVPEGGKDYILTIHTFENRDGVPITFVLKEPAENVRGILRNMFLRTMLISSSVGLVLAVVISAWSRFIGTRIRKNHSREED